jgi:hypothetical protein
MKFGVVDGVLILVHGEREPQDREWDAFLDTYEREQSGMRGLLVFTPGPSPDSARRKRLSELNERRPVPIAVLTPSRIARGVVSALSWLGLAIRAFEPDALDKALDHLALTGATRGKVSAGFDAFQRELKPADSAARSR